MKVFVSTREGQGIRNNDFCFVEDGEIVVYPPIECDRDKGNPDGSCGCTRAMAGIKSQTGTTTFTVEDLYMTREQYIDAVLAYYRDSHGEDITDECKDEIESNCDELLELADEHRIGVVLERRCEIIQERKM